MSEVIPIPYKRPPLTEAVIELRLSKPLEDKELKKIVEKLKERYFFIHENVVMDVATALTNSGIRQQTKMERGFKLENADTQSLAIIMPNSILASALAPYQGWDKLFADFSEIFKTTRKVSDSRGITRIGARFINRIDIPVSDETSSINIADYLNVGLHLPQGLHCKGYELYVELALDEGFQAIVRTASANPTVAYTAATILDMDIFIDKELPVKEEDILDRITKIRHLKNSLFEQFVTNASRALFNREVA